MNTSAWLIEWDGKFWGYRETGKTSGIGAQWTTPDFAIRFARKQDAEKVVQMLFIYSSRMSVHEHLWNEITP